MEKLNLGTIYTALSRVDKKSNWVLVGKVPEERKMYINTHPHMKARREEEMRINALSGDTLKKYGDVPKCTKIYCIIARLGAYCQDNIQDSQCHSQNLEC